MNIYACTKDETIIFAAEELKKYIELMGNKCFLGEEASNSGAVIKLCTCEDIGVDVSIADKDEYIYINIEQGEGIIAGYDSFCVLMAAYQFLWKMGCRWIRPGQSGQYIPKVDFLEFNCCIESSPSFEHRGICIEGASSYENIEQFIDWMPKVGLNEFFLQFMESHAFFKRWYVHENNPFENEKQYSRSESQKIVAKIKNQMKKRGIKLHAVGHGWTCEPLGIHGEGWYQYTEKIPTEVKKYFAQLNGQRELFMGIPLNTQLCYSNPEVQDLMTSYVVEYLKKNSDTDVLHFWLADEYNNYCECDNCRNDLPSEQYVDILNKLDKRLTEEGIKTKIVFVLYRDLYWPPIKNRIKNQDRFILMFAPISRTYSKSYLDNKGNEELSEFKRNNITIPTSNSANINALEKWKSFFKGDSFVFDYHLWCAQYLDLAGVASSKILYDDIKGLKELSVNGFLSCQVQRCAFPTAFSMYIMGRTLWDVNVDYEMEKQFYYRETYGKAYKECISYLDTVTELMDPQYLRGEKDVCVDVIIKNAEDVYKAVEDFSSVIALNYNAENPMQKHSWLVLKEFGNIIKKYADIIKSKALGNEDEVEVAFDAFKKQVFLAEKDIQRDLDAYLLVFAVEHFLVKNKRF